MSNIASQQVNLNGLMNKLHGFSTSPRFNVTPTFAESRQLRKDTAKTKSTGGPDNLKNSGKKATSKTQKTQPEHGRAQPEQPSGSFADSEEFQCLQELLVGFKSNCDTLTVGLTNTQITIDRQEKLIENQNLLIRELNTKIATQEKRICQLEDKVDFFEQQSFSNKVTLSGDAVSTVIDTAENRSPNLDMLLDILNEKLLLNDTTRITATDITYARVISDNKIIVNFQNECPRVLFKKRPISDLYINEYLTKTRSEILFRLRELRRKNPRKVVKVVTRSGKPGILLAGPSQKTIFVETPTSLVKLGEVIMRHPHTITPPRPATPTERPRLNTQNTSHDDRPTEEITRSGDESLEEETSG